jgi:hypothetical protein
MIPVDKILEQALELPVEQRAELLGQLERSLPAVALRARATQPPAPASDDTPITWQGAQGFLDE